MKKILLVSLLGSSTFFNTACTDEEIAAGIIGVGIGIGISADSDRDDHHYHRPPPPPPPRYPGPGCGPRPRRPHRGYATTTKMAVNVQALDFASKYNVSMETAEKIQTAFADVGTKGVGAFEAIGLNKADLKNIAARSMPKAESLQTMATKLDLSQAQARDLVKVLISDFAAQASNVESTYWQSCMAKGSWKTPQNASCKNTEWNGCSPETGATLCY